MKAILSTGQMHALRPRDAAQGKEREWVKYRRAPFCLEIVKVEPKMAPFDQFVQMPK